MTDSSLSPVDLRSLSEDNTTVRDQHTFKHFSQIDSSHPSDFRVCLWEIKMSTKDFSSGQSFTFEGTQATAFDVAMKESARKGFDNVSLECLELLDTAYKGSHYIVLDVNKFPQLNSALLDALEYFVKHAGVPISDSQISDLLK